MLGSISKSSTGTITITLNAQGVAKLQSWISNPATNFGLVLLDYANSNGLDVSSSEGSTVGSRPRLTVTYQ